MKKIVVFAAYGTEEVEMLTVVDVLRRAGIEVTLVSAQNRGKILSSHNVSIDTDANFKDIDLKDYDGLVVPGGLKGVENLRDNILLINALQNFNEKGKMVAAVCAGPTVLGKAGILHGHKATCFPGMDKELNGADYKDEPVVVSDNIITGRGLGASIPFALKIVSYLTDEKTAEKVKKELNGADYKDEPVVVSDNIITGRGLGASIPFALKIVSYLTDEKTAEKVKKEIAFY